MIHVKGQGMHKIFKKMSFQFSTDGKYLTSAEKSFLKRNKSSSALNLHSPAKKFDSEIVTKEEEEQDVDLKKSNSIDERIKKILESVEEPAKENTVKDFCPEIKALSKHNREKTNVVSSDLASLVENGKNFKKSENLLNSYLEDHVNKYEEVRDEIDFEINEEKSKEMTDANDQTENVENSPQNKDATMNFNNYSNVAKKFHDDNLKHQPLPDVINDPMYKALISDRYPFPGESLKVGTMPTAIGWKNYSVPGPTECSKLKIFRPKTASDPKVKKVKEERPKTSKNYVPKKVLPIDLAICWDLKPDDSIKEPKRSLHIDGSNGCIAPAVFTMIHQQDNSKEQNVSGSCLPLAEKISPGIEESNLANLPSQEGGKIQNSVLKCPINKEAIMSCVKASPKDSKQSDSPMSFTSVLTNVSNKTRENSKTFLSNEEASKILTRKLMTLQREKEKKGNYFDPKKYVFNSNNNNNNFNCGSYNDKKINHSTPNLASKCSGSKCGTDKTSQDSFNKNKSLTNLSRGSSDGCKYPNKYPQINKDENKSRSSSGHSKSHGCSHNDNSGKTEIKNTTKTETTKSDSPNSSGSSLGLKSYKGSKNHVVIPGKKKYSIGTLLPPFSYWPQNNSQNYPEHWRLASVYQHSYKPINNRKRPLLASVFQ